MPMPKTSEGFAKADSRNLPTVNTLMLASFFKSAKFLGPELMNVKTTRSCRESYGDNAIGYVEVRRDGDICQVRARITPEHSIHNKDYSVNCVINETSESIMKALCEDCAASAGGGCKHAVAFVTWLHRRSEEPAVTDVHCYWKKSKLSGIGSSIKFIKADDIKKQVVGDVSNEAILQFSIGSRAVVRCASTQLSRQFPESRPNFASFSIHQLICNFKSIQPDSNDAEAFISHCSHKMSSSDCASLASETEEQASSPLWREMRYGRVTASKLFEASRCTTSDGSLVNTILGATKVKDSVAMERGRRLEKAVLAVVSKNKQLKIKNIGLVLNDKLPIFGASPDGVSEEYVLEVKCPMSEKSLPTYFSSDKTKPAEKYLAQIMMQMLMCNKKKGLFCVASPTFETENTVTVLEVNLDNMYVQALMDRAKNFWVNSVFPKLLL